MSDRYSSIDDDDEKMDAGGRWKEFECPECSAHNPYDDGFTVGSEVLCFYCGLNFKVVERGGKYKLKEI